MTAMQTAYRDIREDSIHDNNVEIWNVPTRQVFTKVGTSEIEKFNKEDYEISKLD